MKYFTLTAICCIGLLTACGNSQSDQFTAELNILYSDKQKVAVACPGAAGCSVLEQALSAEAGGPVLTAELDPNQACTQIWGGPETLTVSGVIVGEPVQFTRYRSNGCQIYEYDFWSKTFPPTS